MATWSPSLAIGVPEIDRQHEALFGQVDRFDAAVRAREPGRQLHELFRFLARYAEEHFASEERILRESGYPALADHVAQHADFRRRLAALVPHWESEGESTALLLALTGFLYGWLTAHVGSSDLEAGRWIADHPARS